MDMKRKYSLLVLATGLSLTLNAQRAENHNSALSRNLETFNEIYKQLEMFYVDTLNADTVIGWGIRSMLRQVDPFTDYYPENNEEIRQMTTGKYAGIGSAIRFHKKENRAAISEPFENTPSLKVGLKAGDIIMSIDGKDVAGMPTEKVSQMLRGEAGTTFELCVKRYGEKDVIPFHITRQTIQMPCIPYFGMVHPDVGYINFTDFTENSGNELRQTFLELKKQGAKNLILDLRDNGGGALNEAVNVANLFLPKGKKVVYTKGKMKNTNREYFTANEPADTLIPIVVLVSGGTASSAEIVAGSLQDMDRAVILGTRTYGKGVVQMVQDLPYRGTLKITTSRYYIPSGRCIQAYDYRNLNADGSVGTVPDSLTHVFHTAGGREVRDGGGIKPDVEVLPDSLPTIIYDLMTSDQLFDYATRYMTAHPSIAPAGKFCLSDEEYNAFAEEIAASGFTYNRRSDDVLKLLKSIAQREGYMETAKNEFEALEAKFSNNVKADLMRSKDKIMKYVCNEIVLRYYYQKGSIQQMLTDDPCMERALDLLSKPEEYKRLLSTPN